MQSSAIFLLPSSLYLFYFCDTLPSFPWSFCYFQAILLFLLLLPSQQNPTTPDIHTITFTWNPWFFTIPILDITSLDNVNIHFLTLLSSLLSLIHMLPCPVLHSYLNIFISNLMPILSCVITFRHSFIILSLTIFLFLFLTLTHASWLCAKPFHSLTESERANSLLTLSMFFWTTL